MRWCAKTCPTQHVGTRSKKENRLRTIYSSPLAERHRFTLPESQKRWASAAYWSLPMRGWARRSDSCVLLSPMKSFEAGIRFWGLNGLEVSEMLARMEEEASALVLQGAPHERSEEHTSEPSH